MKLFTIGFIKVTIFDILDIFVISFLLYKLYFFMKGSRAAQMFIGLVFILILGLWSSLQSLAISYVLGKIKGSLSMSPIIKNIEIYARNL